MYYMLKKKKIYILFTKDVIILMILNGEGWYCLAIKTLSSLLTGITSKPDSFRTKHKLESHKKLCENKDFCSVVTSSKDTKILEFTKYQNIDKTPSIAYADRESTTENIGGCRNNSQKLSATKVGEHIPCGYSMSMIWTFDLIENRQDVNRGEDSEFVNH